MRIAVIAIVLGLAGCTTQSVVDGRLAKLPPEMSSAYKAGYGDGCYTVVGETCSASGRGTPRRDAVLIKTDRDYALGWGDGSKACNCAGTAWMYVPLTSD